MKLAYAPGMKFTHWLPSSTLVHLTECRVYDTKDEGHRTSQKRLTRCTITEERGGNVVVSMDKFQYTNISQRPSLEMKRLRRDPRLPGDVSTSRQKHESLLLCTPSHITYDIYVIVEYLLNTCRKKSSMLALQRSNRRWM